MEAPPKDKRPAARRRAEAAFASGVAPEHISALHSIYSMPPQRRPHFRRIYGLVDIVTIAVTGAIRDHGVTLSVSVAIATDLAEQVIPAAINGGPNLVIVTRSGGRWEYEVIAEGGDLRTVNPLTAPFAFVLDLRLIIAGVSARVAELDQ
ncbi:MAG: hypothetical protein LC676_16535 [Loktanella sp.]|nr:hypothetical protein [Loktanella sp.]